MRDTLIIINSFIHDMATGVWLAVLLMMYIISGCAKAVMAVPEGAGFVGGVMDRLWLGAIASMIIIALTGFFRVFSFRRYGWTGDIARGRIKLLLLKHIILGVFVVMGLFLQFTIMVRV